MSWRDRIRGALDDDAFLLYAQPIRDLRDGRIRQHERLLRMRGDDGDVIGLAAFLPRPSASAWRRRSTAGWSGRRSRCSPPTRAASSASRSTSRAPR